MGNRSLNKQGMSESTKLNRNKSTRQQETPAHHKGLEGADWLKQGTE